MHYDADYIRALEHGLPPTAAEGIGDDRFVMLLADARQFVTSFVSRRCDRNKVCRYYYKARRKQSVSPGSLITRNCCYCDIFSITFTIADEISSPSPLPTSAFPETEQPFAGVGSINQSGERYQHNIHIFSDAGLFFEPGWKL